MGRGKGRKQKLKQIQKKILVPLTTMANKAEAVALEARRLCEELKKKQEEHLQQLEDLKEVEEGFLSENSEISLVTSDSECELSESHCTEGDEANFTTPIGSKDSDEESNSCYSRPLPPPPTPSELKEMNQKAAEEVRRQRALRRAAFPRQSKQWRTPKLPINERYSSSVGNVSASDEGVGVGEDHHPQPPVSQEKKKKTRLGPKRRRRLRTQLNCHELQGGLKFTKDDIEKLKKLPNHLAKIREAIFDALAYNPRIHLMLTVNWYEKIPELGSIDRAMKITELFIKWIVSEPLVVLRLARQLCSCKGNKDQETGGECEFDAAAFQQGFDNLAFQPDDPEE